MSLTAHWYNGVRGRNFGDALTEVLFARLVGLELVWAPPSKAALFGAGSIAHRIPEGYAGIIFGTGYMFATQGGQLGAADVVAVRGALTARQGGLGQHGGAGPLLADPGILAGQLLRTRPRRRHRLGVVAHYADHELRHRWRGYPIGILGGVERVVQQVASCDRIVSSSLHALVLADSLGIENRWEPSPAVLGDGHKFRDYASAYGERIGAGTWRLADQAQLAAKAEQLLAGMRRVADAP